MQEDTLFNYKTASDPRAEPAVLQKLAESEDIQVREAVASNPNTPFHIHTRLQKDSNCIVREAIKSI
jgi:hypothetical protein